jgi:hypothetical protein
MLEGDSRLGRNGGHSLTNPSMFELETATKRDHEARVSLTVNRPASPANVVI